MGSLSAAHNAESFTFPTIHHNLHVELIPETHSLRATDTLRLPKVFFDQGLLSFSLNPHLTIDHVELNGQSIAISQMPKNSSDQPLSTQWTIEYPSSGIRLTETLSTLTITYHGQIDDSPTASGGLRFVRPDHTNGHIGPQGIYLTSETFWYPTWERHFVTFELTLSLPPDWQAVTQGIETNQLVSGNRRTSQWSLSSPTEALTLAANKFVVQKKPWRDIYIATYLFPDEAPLAQQYLDATATYLDFYTKILGPYPFKQFAVVENFFPSGLGMPSFTLLGQSIVRRGYTQPYSLGHEIVHSWLGNSVFNSFAKGNWVEGLTTYLANYYYEEAIGHHTDATKIRRRMMDEYNLYATPDKDYPIHLFHHKETRIDNAVGYQKTALVFHMLRQQVGDEAFFKAIHHIVRVGTGRYLEWEDLKGIFSEIANYDLTEFFQQWIDRPGAPSMTFDGISIQTDPQHSNHYMVSGTLFQNDAFYKLPLPIQVNLRDGSIVKTTLTLDHKEQPFSLNVSSLPISMILDPEHHWLLRLDRGQLPPMLNGWDTGSHRIVIHGKTVSKEEDGAFQVLMKRIQSQSDVEIQQQDSPSITEAASYLIIGTPARRVLESGTFQICHNHVQMHSGRVTLFEQEFEGQDLAFLFTCPHPRFSNHTVSFFFGFSPEAITPVARLLFFYGWDSYLVFQKGKVVARGMFQPVHSAREFRIPPP